MTARVPLRSRRRQSPRLTMSFEPGVATTVITGDSHVAGMRARSSSRDRERVLQDGRRVLGNGLSVSRCEAARACCIGGRCGRRPSGAESLWPSVSARAPASGQCAPGVRPGTPPPSSDEGQKPRASAADLPLPWTTIVRPLALACDRSHAQRVSNFPERPSGAAKTSKDCETALSGRSY